MIRKSMTFTGVCKSADIAMSYYLIYYTSCTFVSHLRSQKPGFGCKMISVIRLVEMSCHLNPPPFSQPVVQTVATLSSVSHISQFKAEDFPKPFKRMFFEHQPYMTPAALTTPVTVTKCHLISLNQSSVPLLSEENRVMWTPYYSSGAFVSDEQN